jgi:ethanolamine utilization protein EutN
MVAWLPAPVSLPVAPAAPVVVLLRLVLLRLGLTLGDPLDTLAGMYLGKVIGTVVATRKYEGLEGVKLLLVQPLDHQGRPSGEPHAAADTVRAGLGELVYLVGSREASLALDPWFVPVDAAIVGIVDQLDAKP